MKPFLDIIINSKTEMKRFGHFLSNILMPGDVITLDGSVGVGKTFLCKSIINKITKIKEIPSPTFNLVLTYPYKLNNEICHCDFYRINSFDEVEELGIFEDLKKIILLEWPKFNAEINYFDPLILRIEIIKNIEKERSNNRRISLFGSDNWYKKINDYSALKKDYRMNFVFYDLETTGRNSTWDQIIQVGAILVDEKFNEIERFEERCRLRPGVVPEPGALIVNNTSIEMLNSVNLSHYDLIKKIQHLFKRWSPAVFIGYNTINFDEEFLRKTFFKLLFEPYITQFNGNKRADVLGITRSSKFYYPNTLKVGLNEKGNQVFKLDNLTYLNNINHNAHDAMGDVEATIELAKNIHKKSI